MKTGNIFSALSPGDFVKFAFAEGDESVESYTVFCFASRRYKHVTGHFLLISVDEKNKCCTMLARDQLYEFRFDDFSQIYPYRV